MSKGLYDPQQLRCHRLGTEKSSEKLLLDTEVEQSYQRCYARWIRYLLRIEATMPLVIFVLHDTNDALKSYLLVNFVSK